MPRDCDGVFIHVGDILEPCSLIDMHRTTLEVEAIGIGSFVAYDDASKSHVKYDAVGYRHHRKDSWERIIEDARYVGTLYGIDELVGRCKKLAER